MIPAHITSARQAQVENWGTELPTESFQVDDLHELISSLESTPASAEELFDILIKVSHRPGLIAELQTSPAFPEVFKLHDSNGNNIALEWIKENISPQFHQELLKLAETSIAKHANAAFDEHFRLQIEHIQKVMTCAFETCQQRLLQVTPSSNLSSFWSWQPEIQAATARTQSIILKDMAASTSNLLVLNVDADPVFAAIAETSCKQLESVKLLHLHQSDIQAGSIDAILAPHTFERDMIELVKATEEILHATTGIEAHPLYRWFEMLKEGGCLIATLKSGPNIEDLANIMLGRIPLEYNTEGQALKWQLLQHALSGVETFLRILDAFKKPYEIATGQTLTCELSYSQPHIPLDVFCGRFAAHFPEIERLGIEEQAQFMRLLSVFTVEDDIVDLNMTLKISKQATLNLKPPQCFKPIPISSSSESSETKAPKAIGSNEISLGQSDLSKQTQNLNGSETAMIYIKDADGQSQIKALTAAIGNKVSLKFLDLGGGRGETNAISKALVESGCTLDLLNVEPHAPFVQPYIAAHKGVGVDNVRVLEQKAELSSAADIMKCFSGQKADIVFASHFFYFLLGDMHKAAVQRVYSPLKHAIQSDPLCKFFDTIKPGGAMVATIQSGLGARTVREILLGNHNLNFSNIATDKTTPLLSCFGNLATLMRHLESFAARYKELCGEQISIKMFPSVANVPLGTYSVKPDLETGEYRLNELSKLMLDYYGNWKQLQTLATLTLQKALEKSPEELKALGISELTEEHIASQRERSRKKQKTFLDILPLFALGGTHMQHPNITLLITKESEK